MNNNQILKTTLIISGLMLVFAIGNLPYGYYQFLRLVIFVSGLFAAYRFYEVEKSKLASLFGIAALLFNPIFPVYLDKSTWIGIDLITSFLYFYSANQVPGKKS